MITTEPKENPLQGIHRLIKRAYVNCWDEVVAEQEPLFNELMKRDKQRDHLRAVMPLVRDMERRNQDPSLIIAVAYELRQRRIKEDSKTRKGWTL
jgi:hypothetical protein